MIQGHPHTVRDSHVPLYMQGFSLLGQDPDFDFTPPAPVIPPDFPLETPVAPDLGVPYFSPASELSPVPNQFQPLLDRGFTQPQAELISGAAASGHINDAQFQSILAGSDSRDSVLKTIFGTARTAAEIAAGAAAGNKPKLGPGPSPRVGTKPASFFSKESAIPGVSNGLLVAAGATLLLVFAARR